MDAKSYTVRTETGEIRLMTKQQVGQLVKQTLQTQSPKDSSLSRPIVCPTPTSPYTTTSQRLSRSPRGMPRKFQFRSSEMQPREVEEVDTTGTMKTTSTDELGIHSTLSPSNKSVTELVSLSIRKARQNASKRKSNSFQQIWQSNDVTTSPIKKHSTFSWSLDDDDDENRICGQFEDLIVSNGGATLGGLTMGDTTVGTAALNRYDTLEEVPDEDDDDQTVNTVNTSKKEPTPTNNYQKYKIFRSFFTPNASPEIASIIEDTMRRAKETATGNVVVENEPHVEMQTATPAGILKTTSVADATLPGANDPEQREEEEEIEPPISTTANEFVLELESREPAEPYDSMGASTMSTQEQSLSDCIHGAGAALQQQPTPRSDFTSFSETPRLFNGKRRIKTFHIIEEQVQEEVGVELQIESTSASLTSSTPEDEASSEPSSSSQGDEPTASSSMEDKSFSSTSMTHTPLIPDAKIDIVRGESDEEERHASNSDDVNDAVEDEGVEFRKEVDVPSAREPEEADKVADHENIQLDKDSVDTAELKETAGQEILSIDSDESYDPSSTRGKRDTEFRFSEKGRKLSVETALYTPLNGTKEGSNEFKARSTTSVPSRPLLMVKQCPSSDDEYPLATSVRKTLSESLHSTTSSRRRSNSVSDSSYKKGTRRLRSRNFRPPNRKRTESYETKGSSVVTEEFLASIASMKGETITLEEVTMLLQATNSPDDTERRESKNSQDSLTGNYPWPSELMKAISLPTKMCLDLVDLLSPFEDLRCSNEDVPDEFQNDSNNEMTESATDEPEEENTYYTTGNDETANDETENYETDEGFEMTVTEKRVTFSFSNGEASSSSSEEDDTTATTGGW